MTGHPTLPPRRPQSYADQKTRDGTEMTISGAGIRRMRLLRSMKQQHLAELLGVNQATVSRWERDQLALSPEQAVRLERIFAPPHHAVADAALKRLVEDCLRPVHLICDSTHRLLSASRPRQSEWRAPIGAFLGRSLSPTPPPRSPPPNNRWRHAAGMTAGSCRLHSIPVPTAMRACPLPPAASSGNGSCFPTAAPVASSPQSPSLQLSCTLMHNLCVV